MIISHLIPHSQIHLIGNQPRQIFPNKIAGLEIPASRCYLQVASDSSKPGFQTIIPWQATPSNQPLQADGVVMTQANTAALFHTADCPAVVFSNIKTGTATAIHAGRPAMTLRDGENIITRVLANLKTEDGDFKNLHVYITGAICGKHFRHDHAHMQTLAEPFLKTFGKAAFSDVDTLALDLVKVISFQLTQAGVTENKITHDCVCTYETAGLTSHRRDGKDRTTSNLVLVIKN